MKRWLHWSVEPAARVYVGLLFVLICLVVAGGWAKITADEHSFCVVQARGLPAGHELATSMQEIHALLILVPNDKAGRLAAQNTPASVKKLVKDLNMHLAQYSKLEGEQPQTRSC